MQTVSATQPGKWYFNLLDKVQELVRRFDLPEDIATEVQGLTIEIAREQFKAGNKSGIAWLKKQQAAGVNRAPVAA